MSQSKNSDTVVAKPFLRWAGSKRQLVSTLASFWSDDYDRYVEPFCGSSALFFEIAPSRALLADKNGELIHTYEVLRDNPEELYTAATSLPRGKSAYYRIRAQNSCNLSALDRAARFLYLNRFCFNGLYRTNQSGQFNVPHASRGTGEFPSAQQFTAIAKLLVNAKLRVSDFGRTLNSARCGDFVYMDPPYAVTDRRMFREYTSRPFALRDLNRLVRHLDGLHERGVAFLVSYADCTEARRLFAPWHPRRIRVRRHIAGFSSSRRHAYELLVSNR